MQQSQLQFDPAHPASDATLLEVRRAARRAEAGHRDELLGGDRLRPPWQRFFTLLAADGGLADLERRNAALAAQIRRNGVTYNVYGDAAGRARPWPLGLLPLLIEPAEWRAIEAGIAQRTRLMEAVLADGYGEQALLREGLLPPALLHGHPGYLHALHGVAPVGGVRLHVCAFDIARGPGDSGWWVVSQRTQAPSGLGYVLENRMAVSRQFPEAFREMRVQHIASAYRQLLDTLLTLAAPIAQAEGHGTPRLVLLTPGPYNETYFEQTYLARYLGLPLVEGGDLTVRDQRLYLKTVQGLEPVHGLLRRLDDDWCDPLELRPDSALGVPGLLQVLRAGRVVMANALGTGFLESPGIQGFLPALAQHLLGEDLSLPSLPTWWCGEASAWAVAREALAERVIRPTYPGVAGRGFEPVIAATLTPSQCAGWAARIEAAPDLHTLQRYLPFAQTPWWEGGALQPRTAMLRVYAIADGHGGYRVLPGGMTRVAAQGRHAVSMQQGGASIDTWVLTDGAVDPYSMLPQRLRPEEIALHRRPVSSRTAENLFWMGRYTERTEQLVRLAQAAAALVEDDDEAPPAVLDAVSALAESAGLAPPGVPSLAQSPRVFERAVVAALCEASESRSIGYNLAALDRTAGALRDRLSPEHGRLVRAMAEDFAARLACGRSAAPGVEPAGGFGAGEFEAALEHLATQLAAVTGAQSDRMTRDDGWRLLTVGRLIERLIAMSTTLRAFFARGAVHTTHGFDLLLGLFDSTITYRSRHPGRQETLALLDLLVIDTANPRALGCVLRRLHTEIGKLPGGGKELLALLPACGAGVTLAELCREDGEGPAADDARVVGLADALVLAGGRLSDEVGRRYFALAERQEQHLVA
ncbi:MAG TPA: circularly permuted type 2 ATP-grasp protein [Methylibium sp.]|nr:circularly permuted type 2 ATP-grasp protein [Methylibium sp.]